MAPQFRRGLVRVRPPATSANLGPGFDALGLALELRDEVTCSISDHAGVRVAVTGEGAGDLPADGDHLVAKSMAATFGAMGLAQPVGIELTCSNRIPQARGLGSSSAAIVAGVLLARGLVTDGRARLPDAHAIAIAAELEGHPDNVAACMLGGLTIAWLEGGARAVRLELAPAVRLMVFVPAQRSLTAPTRSALPDNVPHTDAAHAAGRTALLVHALTADPTLLMPATEDRLHQIYRAGVAPASFALMNALREAGVPAVISGAGPSILALTSTNWSLPDLGPEWRQIPVVSARTGGLDAVDWQHAEREPVAAGLDS